MKYLLSITCMMMILSSYAQDSTLSENYKYFYYPNGTISSEGTMVDGKPDGYWKAYYPTGLIKSEGNRKNFILDGSWKFYNEAGDLKEEINYIKGKKNGLNKLYDDSCRLIQEDNYKDNQLHGESKTFYPLDSLLIHTITPYDENIKDGNYYEYAKDGRIITVIVYNNGFVKNKEEINRRNKRGKQGTWKTFFDNMDLQIESRYKDDVLHGYYKKYDRDGKLVTAILYIDGVAQENVEELALLDMRRTYHSNGQLKTEGGYNIHGKEEGLFKEFKADGSIKEAREFKNGVLLSKGEMNLEGQKIGPWEYYYPDSSIRAKGKYKEGKRIGQWVFYHANGKMEQKGKYVKNEKPHGDWVWFYDTGDIMREESFRKGLEDGLLTEYSDSATIITQGEFIDGQKEGPWYYIMGDYKEEGEYFGGRKTGEWKHYYISNGKESFKGSYVDGEPDGKHLHYYDNGKIKREEVWSYGMEEGTWKSYDEFGTLTITIYYRNGKEVKIDKKKVK